MYFRDGFTGIVVFICGFYFMGRGGGGIEIDYCIMMILSDIHI
jgi:hypothetical protein